MVAGSGSSPSRDKDAPSDLQSPQDKTDANLSHVLVVENNESDVLLIREALEGTGLSLSVHLAKDGEQAVRFLDRAGAADSPCPALVVLDIDLPKLQGERF
jgi:CheY-like chemotaxis protein